MSRRKLFSFRIFGKLLSSVTPFGFKMVRYFPNPYEDFKPSEILVVDKNEVKTHIDENIQIILKRLVPTRKGVEIGLYVGIAGVSYMFYYLSKNPLLSENKDLYLEKAAAYLAPALATSTPDKASFLLGDAGVHALAAVVHKEQGEEHSEYLNMYRSLFNYFLNPKLLKCGGDEFFVGRAGYLAGALWLSKELKVQVFSNSELYKICDIMVTSGREYAQKQGSQCPLLYHYYNTHYMGAAHGVAFIMQMLLSVPGYLDYNKSAAADIKNTVNFIATLQTEDGNWPCCLEEVELNEHKLVHWCHGAPGMVYLMAKAYLLFEDKKFLDACIKASDLVWQKGLLHKGPGLCHGVAGNGYVFLLLYRLTNDQKYLYRAKRFADFMNTEEFMKDARLPDNPESLYEGIAGTVCFLSDLILPEKMEFPFQDVFVN